jgi:hypothetical protein
MGSDQYFNPKRLWLLLRNDVLSFYRSTLISVGTLVVVLLLFFFVSTVSGRQGGSYLPIFGLILFIGGFLFTSSSFSDLHHKHKSALFLTLPSSNLEKFLGKLILTSVGYAVGVLVFFHLFTLLVYGLNLLFFDRPLTPFNPFQAHIFEYIGAYLVTQSIFLLGAVTFKTRAFIKTILSISGFFLALMLFSFFVIWLFYKDYFTGQVVVETFQIESVIHNKHIFVEIVRILFWVVLAPFLWWISYLRLRESEVQDGIS